MKRQHVFLSIIGFITIFSCDKPTTSTASSVNEDEQNTGYKITPVNIQNVKLTDEFWLPIIKRVQEKTIDYAIKKSEEEGRFDNFLIAGGKMEGPVKGKMPFDDSDVYKVCLLYTSDAADDLLCV